MNGVRDNVGALGIPRREADMPGYFTEFHQLELPSNVTPARHALALTNYVRSSNHWPGLATRAGNR